MKMEKIFDDFFTDGEGSENDGEYKFNVGDFVLVRQTGYQEMKEHWISIGIATDTFKGFIRSRRNAYPGMGFHPIYYVVGLGEVYENCLEKLSE